MEVTPEILTDKTMYRCDYCGACILAEPGRYDIDGWVHMFALRALIKPDGVLDVVDHPIAATNCLGYWRKERPDHA